MKIQRRLLPIGAAFVVAAVSLSDLHAQFVEDEVVVASGSNWDYLLYAPDNGGVFTPVDPATVDNDFHTTWQLGGAGYDGPEFLNGAAALGYGAVTGDPAVTNIWGARDGSTEPPSGLRYTAYFRTTFTPTRGTNAVRISGIIDDGAIIYFDGVELARTTNLVGGDTWALLTNAVGDEDAPVTGDIDVALPAGVEVTVAVSVHQVTTDSSDLGMNLQIITALPVPASPPPNDNFADAELLSGPLPVATAGRTHDDASAGHLVGATAEALEPNHAGIVGTGSIWYRFTPAADSRVVVSTVGSNFDTILAVYTGAALGELVEVAASTGGDRFYAGSRVTFDAIAGTTYSIAVDGAGNGGAPVEGENFGDVNLTISLAAPPLFTEIETLLPRGSDWFYLLAAEDDAIDPSLTNQPVDPALVGAGDADFHTTWHTAASYDGPPFSGPAPALLGYGVIEASPVFTDIWGARDIDGDAATEDLAPPSGLRYATYFRTTFTPTSAVSHLGFRGLVDDGAAIFINGTQVAAMNFNADPADWQAFALDNVDTELAPQEAFALDVDLPPNVPVEIGVTVRSNNATSSDIGFDLELYSIEAPQVDFGKDLAANDPLKASFETANPGAVEGFGDLDPDDNLPWFALSGTVQDESGLPNPPAAPGNAIFVNNGGIDLLSGRADLRNVDNAGVVVTVGFRCFEDSAGSDFEVADSAEAYIEGTTDGFSFSRIATIMPLQVGGAGIGDPNDQLKPLELPGGTYTTFSSSPGAIPDGVLAIRVVVQALNNSNSERFFIDNICIGKFIPPFAATITHNRLTGENRIEWENDGISVYILRFSTDLVNWVQVGADVEIGPLTHTPPAGTTGGFYQVLAFED